MNIGDTVKELRKQKGMTIKDLAEKVGLSTGFISQFERGMTTIDVDHLHTIATALGVDISHFFISESREDEPESPIVHRYDRRLAYRLNQTLYFDLATNLSGMHVSPKYVEMLPRGGYGAPETYRHPGEEFIYVLEGVLTLLLDENVYQLYPGDAALFASTREHNWGNETSGVVKFIVVHHPNAGWKEGGGEVQML